MTTLIADSGSTKTDWLLLLDSGNTVERAFSTSGFNPCLMTDEEIVRKLRAEVLPELSVVSASVVVDCIWFYGAGCRPDQLNRMSQLLCSTLFAREAHVASDLLGAARALCGDTPGIVGILGTGSGSALYDGHQFTQQTPSLGYVLGDEGSGAVLGRRLLSDIFKCQLPENIIRAFESETLCTIDEAIARVYRSSAPNRYLAQFTHFLSAHLSDDSIRNLVVDEFRKFIRRNIMAYNHPEMSINLVGSIAYIFRKEVCKAAESLGYTIGNVLRTPIDGLRDYHKCAK